MLSSYCFEQEKISRWFGSKNYTYGWLEVEAMVGRKQSWGCLWLLDRAFEDWQRSGVCVWIGWIVKALHFVGGKWSGGCQSDRNEQENPWKKYQHPSLILHQNPSCRKAFLPKDIKHLQSDQWRLDQDSKFLKVRLWHKIHHLKSSQQHIRQIRLSWRLHNSPESIQGVQPELYHWGSRDCVCWCLHVQGWKRGNIR